MPASAEKRRPPRAEPLSPEEETDSRLGPEYQAQLPEAAQLPAGGPTPDEACWLEGLLLLAGSAAPPARSSEELAALAAAEPDARAAAVESARLELCAVVGDALVPALGLDSMGATYVGVLSAEEEAVLHAGFKEHGEGTANACLSGRVKEVGGVGLAHCGQTTAAPPLRSPSPRAPTPTPTPPPLPLTPPCLPALRRC